jgi:two-component system sensor histidine kinase AlgZ
VNAFWARIRTATGTGTVSAGDFLPDFCDVRVVFLVVLATELMAFILALAQPTGASLWSYLGLVSLFMQWITLCCTALLCRLRPWLARRPLWLAALLSYLLILLVTFGFSQLSLGAGLTVLPITGNAAAFHARNLAIAGIVGAVVLRYFYLQQQYRQRLKREAEARHLALQARIQPHFLFNSMNIIASLTRSNPRLAETVVENLSDLFRAALARADRLVSLKEEFELCQRYLDIEQLRLGPRLRVHLSLDEAVAAVPVPPLLLQPLVENAVYHGIQPRTEGGELWLTARAEAGRVCIAIRNPYDPAHRSPGHGLALDNIRERLALRFGPLAGLQIHSEEAATGVVWFVVELSLPLSKESVA